MNYWHRRTAQAKLEQDGARYVHPDYPAWTFWLRRFSTWAPGYQRSLARIAEQPDVADYLNRAKQPEYKPTPADDAIDKRMVLEAFAEGVIVRWDVHDQDGLSLPYSTEDAAKLLEHFPDIYADMRAWAVDARHFRPISDDAKAKLAAGN